MEHRLITTVLKVASTMAAALLIAGPASATPGEWHEDIRYLRAEMPAAHPNLFHTLTAEEFEQELDRLDKVWPDLDRKEAVIELSRMLAKLRDGHSMVAGFFPDVDPEFRLLPVQFYEFPDGLYVRSAHQSYAGLAGSRVLQIGGIDADEAVRRVSALSGHDNQMSVKSRTPAYMQSAVVLKYLGLSKTDDSIDLRVEKDGVVSSYTVKPDPMLAAKSPYGMIERADWIDAGGLAVADRALYLRHPDTAIWHNYDAQARIYYLQVNAFEKTDEDEFSALLDSIGADMETRTIDRFVLDVRNNQGGETGLVPPLAKWLLANPAVNRKDRFFVIIGRRTFSATQLLLNALSQYSDAIFVGEPTGSSPIFYANSRPNVVLADKDISILLPTKLWQTVNADDDRLCQEPDISAEPTSDDYRSNRDPAMEAVRNYRD